MVLSFLFLGLASALHSQQRRVLQVEDLMALEQVGPVAVSPDGRWVAVVIVRSKAGEKTHRDFPSDEDRADIWLVERHGSRTRNITSGVVDGSGYWNPVWSPDSKRLALLSTKGGINVHPYAWELATGQLRRLSDRGVDLQAYGDDGFPTPALIWIDSTSVLCPVRADGAPPSYYVMARTRSLGVAVRQWAKAEQGRTPTASVLESGRELPEAQRPMGALLAIDVVSGRSRVVAKGNIRQLMLSPTRRHVAVIAETGRIPPRPNRKVPYDIDDRHFEWRTRLAILPLRGGTEAIWVDSLFDAKLVYEQLPHAWSPDGEIFAAVAKAAKDDETATTLWLVGWQRAARRVTGAELKVRAVAWSSRGDLLALARPQMAGEPQEETPRLDWWLVDHRKMAKARKITGKMNAVPPFLVQAAAQATMLGIVSGDLWAIDIADSTTNNLTQIFQPEIEDRIWPRGASLHSGTVTKPVVRTRNGDLYRLTRSTPSAILVPVPRPSPVANLVAYSPEHDLSVFNADAGNGAFLWTGDGRTNRFQQRLSLNGQLSQIGDGKRILVDYRATEGDSQKAVIILPAGYESGKRYPLIAYVYASLVVTDTTFGPGYRLLEKSFVSSLNLHLLSAHGYAVLIPSMPLAPPTMGRDPYLDLPKGVIAAVDRAIDLGIADPNRLGVMGHSLGGYSTYALVTYTQRFKVAVALAGPANLISLYGSFWPSHRYDSYAHEDLFFAALSESGGIRMGDTPWGDLWRYLRNSPLYYVERVRTPLMIIHGDIDFVPMQQGEEFFTALYRLGKKAKFVRYWGEGHVISSPANVQDMWQRIYGWLDEHLKPMTPPEDAAATVGSAGAR